ncbi:MULTISPECIES: hypothetical protein [unclassified Sphingomonas]|uniref:hypothetical protein n=1 Tax=unclassified Sphingomonas TaxID=196159 RepID=UPI0008347A0D|nr:MULTISPECIES: hypothetical protein [unclassified Sphingomonas]
MRMGSTEYLHWEADHVRVKNFSLAHRGKTSILKVELHIGDADELASLLRDIRNLHVHGTIRPERETQDG